jgi:hypothetical protein
MLLGQLTTYFNTSPAIALLRAEKNAPYIIAFLHRQFKRANRITASASELLAALTAYQEELHDTDPDVLGDKPENYLASWCSANRRWLHRFLEADQSEPVYQLTPHTEEVFAFLDRALDKDLGFVGTESRLRLAIETLADLVLGASDDPEVRLAHLQSEKERIEREIDRIQHDGVISTYQPAQIRERFATAVSLLKQLQGDFRAVEDKFKEITQDVQRRQSEGRDTRGGIVGYVLDSEDKLKEQDQGVSFYEFVRFIHSSRQQERLQDIIQGLRQLDALAEQTDGMQVVRRMVPSLLAEAQKVMRTNQRLSATLRRLLDGRAYRDRRRVAVVIREILGLAVSLADAPPDDSVAVEVENRIRVSSPLAKSFWTEPQRFEAIDLTESAGDERQRDAAFRMLAEMQRLDWKRMRACIADAVAASEDVTLGRLLDENPPEAGVVEVLGYLQVARDDGHIISDEATEDVLLNTNRPDGRLTVLTVPLVRFIVT